MTKVQKGGRKKVRLEIEKAEIGEERAELSGLLILEKKVTDKEAFHGILQETRQEEVRARKTKEKGIKRKGGIQALKIGSREDKEAILGISLEVTVEIGVAMHASQDASGVAALIMSWIIFQGSSFGVVHHVRGAVICMTQTFVLNMLRTNIKKVITGSKTMIIVTEMLL